MEPVLQEVYDVILNGRAKLSAAKVQAALDAGVEPSRILNEGMIAALGEVGRLFEEGEYFVPEMLVAAKAMQAGITVLRPHLMRTNVQAVGRVVIGTVKGDLHDIGKNLVTMMLEGAGFEVNDLGIDVPPEKFVEAAGSGACDIVALSALLTTTMPMMKTTIEALKQAGVRDQVKVLVGGAPVTDAYAERIGADAYAPDANRAVIVAKALLGNG
ncbi:MAG: corrinoid protein [Anaerolineae bacterium]